MKITNLSDDGKIYIEKYIFKVKLGSGDYPNAITKLAIRVLYCLQALSHKLFPGVISKYLTTSMVYTQAHQNRLQLAVHSWHSYAGASQVNSSPVQFN